MQIVVTELPIEDAVGRARQAEEDPSLTVEVLDRVDRAQSSLIAQWNRHASATAKQAQ